MGKSKTRFWCGTSVVYQGVGGGQIPSGLGDWRLPLPFPHSAAILEFSNGGRQGGTMSEDCPYGDCGWLCLPASSDGKSRGRGIAD